MTCLHYWCGSCYYPGFCLIAAQTFCMHSFCCECLFNQITQSASGGRMMILLCFCVSLKQSQEPKERFTRRGWEDKAMKDLTFTDECNLFVWENEGRKVSMCKISIYSTGRKKWCIKEIRVIDAKTLILQVTCHLLPPEVVYLKCSSPRRQYF